MSTIDSLISQYPQALLERLMAPPPVMVAELGEAVEELVVQGLQAFDALPPEVQEQGSETVLGSVLGAWGAQLDLDALMPLRKLDWQSTAVEGLTVADVEAALLHLPLLHRSPLAVVLMATRLVLQAIPNATRREQAAAVLVLLRQLDGWLPPHRVAG